MLSSYAFGLSTSTKRHEAYVEHQKRPRGWSAMVVQTVRACVECGGQISPGSTGRLEGLTKGLGPIVSQESSFRGPGENCWQNGLT
jgi:hypothetical protein